MTEPNENKSLWHGRFATGPAEALLDLSNEQATDMNLALHDVAGSLAHVKGLVHSSLLTPSEGDELARGLGQVLSEIMADKFTISISDEDIHMAVERRLTEVVGEVGGKLHTARSRNDQTATDLRLFVRHEIRAIVESVIGLQHVLLGLAEQAGSRYVPGYTHLQRAQPVLLAHHFGAHCWALSRDVDRLLQTAVRLNVSPLGAGALAGTSLEVDPEYTAEELGFDRAFDNSLDVTSDRDYVAETMFDIALLSVHISRMAEEIVLWNSEEFGFMKLSDEFSTGSSMMPQKKNPDVAELARGKSGIFIGQLTGVLATLKGLPLAYNRDLQTLKPDLFEATKAIRSVVAAMGGCMQTATFNNDVMEAAADGSMVGATDLAEWLVDRGTPFRKAHEIVGSVVGVSTRGSIPFAKAVADDPLLGPEAAALLEPGASVSRRISRGGAGPDAVAHQLKSIAQRLGADAARVADLFA